MKALVVVGSILFVLATAVGAQAGERVGQDPDEAGADALPGAGEAGERVGNDPDVPGGEMVSGTPVPGGPTGRIGNDPEVPIGDAPVR